MSDIQRELKTKSEIYMKSFSNSCFFSFLIFHNKVVYYFLLVDIFMTYRIGKMLSLIKTACLKFAKKPT